eukprot:4682646-Pleurochrysis_carterae.AAC.1
MVSPLANQQRFGPAIISRRFGQSERKSNAPAPAAQSPLVLDSFPLPSSSTSFRDEILKRRSENPTRQTCYYCGDEIFSASPARHAMAHMAHERSTCQDCRFLVDASPPRRKLEQ